MKKGTRRRTPRQKANAARCRAWRRRHPDRVKKDNARRRKRADRRDRHGIWGVRLRLLMLHCGEFHTRIRDKYYEAVEVRLTIYELAVIWFRDKAWTMKEPHCDRIDPEGHYEFSNCRYIEATVNLKRRTARSAFLGDKTEVAQSTNGREPGEDG